MATVHIRATGQAFDTQSGEPLLDAAIRSGLSLPYGCSSGNCGLCRATLVTGTISAVRAHDFMLSEAQRARGDFLMCSQAADGDIEIEVAVDDDVTAIPKQTLVAKVRRVECSGEGLMLIQLRVPRTQRLRFLAGQYATLILKDGTLTDSAIASCPCDEQRLDFHIRRLPGDAFSDYVFEQLRVGETLTVEAPSGRFTFDEQAQGPAVFIAFDTGFAAIKSILEHLTAQESTRRIYLHRICCGRRDLYMDNLCRSWADALDEFSYHPHIIDDSFRHWATDMQGMDKVETILSDLVTEHPDWSQTGVYVCAPEAVGGRLETLLSNQSLSRDRLHSEIIRGNSYSRCLDLSS